MNVEKESLNDWLESMARPPSNIKDCSEENLAPVRSVSHVEFGDKEMISSKGSKEEIHEVNSSAESKEVTQEVFGKEKLSTKVCCPVYLFANNVFYLSPPCLNDVPFFERSIILGGTNLTWTQL